MQDAIVAALRTWRTEGVPPSPGAWLTLTARRRAIDRLRRSVREARALEALMAADPANVEIAEAVVTEPEADERIPMLFGCCHPALRIEARIPLMLRAVVGLTTAQIARAFLVPEPTMAQRLVRAKRKITATGIAFTIPEDHERAERLDDVLTAILLTYDTAYLTPGDGRAADAVWLADLVARSLPDEPEAWGLLALVTSLAARSAARFDGGRLVVLAEQDRQRWDAVASARAVGYIEHAGSMRRPGRFQLQAAIAACHNEAENWDDTDWLQIVTLYDLLYLHDRSPVVRLNHAIALRHVAGPEAALAEVDEVAERLDAYHLLHATRAQLLRELGRTDEARAANERALELTENAAEQELLRARLAD